MKFEKFVKKAMPHASTITVDGKDYLAYGRMYVKIPEWAGKFGIKSDKTELLDQILNDLPWGENEADLIKAYLPTPDAKAKEIIREFSDGEVSVRITNEEFALIESHDMLVIASDEEGEITALLVGKYSSIADFEPEAIILDIETKED